MRDVLTTDDRERFKHAAAFTTSSWTSSYTDCSAWTVYTAAADPSAIFAAR